MIERSTVIEVRNISKSFGKVQAISSLSFDVQNGEIFGLLGPNGAGKTTCIRILLDIFQPDSGAVEVFGSAMTEKKKDRIGYLPEERGLYQDAPLERCLVYLASLKGLSREVARSRIGQYLEQFNLSDSRRKKVKELSKGMQQKAQLIATLVHDPDLIIIDEPFTALDPVNTQMVKDILRNESRQGRTVIMCTHQMHQVQELCDRILLVNQGTSMLYGPVDDIRHRFAGRELLLKTADPWQNEFSGVEVVQTINNGTLKLRLTNDWKPQMLLKSLVERGVLIEHFEISLPGLDDIFIRVVNGNEQGI